MTLVSEVAKWNLVLAISFATYLLGTLLGPRMALLHSFVHYWGVLCANYQALITILAVMIGALAFSVWKCVPVSATTMLLFSLIMAVKAIEYELRTNQVPLSQDLAMASAGTPLTKLLSIHAMLGLSICVVTVIMALVMRFLLRIGDGRSDPLAQCLKALPVLFCILVPCYALVITHLGAASLLDSQLARISLTATITVGAMACAYLLCRLLLTNKTKQLVFVRFPQEMLEYAPRASDDVHSAELGVATDPSTSTSKAKAPVTSEETLSRVRAEESFTWLLLFALGLASLLQGIVDSALLLCLLGCIDPHREIPFAKAILQATMGMGALFLSGRILEGLSFVKAIRSSFAASVEIGTALPFLAFTAFDKPLSSLLGRILAMLFTAWILGKEVNWKKLARSTFLMLLVTVATPCVTLLALLVVHKVDFFLALPDEPLLAATGVNNGS